MEVPAELVPIFRQVIAEHEKLRAERTRAESRA